MRSPVTYLALLTVVLMSGRVFCGLQADEKRRVADDAAFEEATTPEPSDSADGSDKQERTDATEHEIPRVSLEVARDRIDLLNGVYLSTLDVMHDRYFHREHAVVPARAMEDVFKDMKAQTQIDARWIAVSLKAMSVNHEPETAFEKRSAREIKAGKRTVEAIEDGYYRRATAIPLTGGCVHCHDGFFRQPSASTKFAGLVISIPVREGETLESPTESE
ncbi:MAG: hypothetical protein KDA96_13200 [Planctomycetaceae bacterium]|nr:hypothetical protein [Planctomycetaceae bacterium]